MERNKRIIKRGFVLALIFTFIYLIFSLNIFKKDSIMDILLLGKERDRFGIFFTIFITFLLVFFVPLSWFSPLAAFFFGYKGFIYVVIGGTAASILSFIIARIFKSDIINILNKIYYRKERNLDLDEVSIRIEKYGLRYIFFMRSMPFVPFGIANYVSGISSVSIKDYIFGTTLGLIPSQAINSYFYVKAINFGRNPLKALFAALIKGIYVLLIILWQRKSKYNAKE
ncbi:TVP38/TMEM64 family protein [Clostridium sp. Cult2]|uniref:TVP38/TMEM64 family protein n=1 Tax=Clostridium sp. Cult2 TaxID=2079003 RepID=UPI001F398AC4|nr:VTT domain-containing protein [Clostridium sp. Cult2]MCF6465250.1 hypothetical protein [Clostridium sp. Cult2]